MMIIYYILVNFVFLCFSVLEVDTTEDTCIGMSRDSHQTVTDETEALDCEFKIPKGPDQNIDAV